MKSIKELELKLIVKDAMIQQLKLKVKELEEQRERYAHYIFSAIEKTLYLIDEGNEWHWDNGVLENYAEDILKCLRGEDNEN